MERPLIMQVQTDHQTYTVYAPTDLAHLSPEEAAQKFFFDLTTDSALRSNHLRVGLCLKRVHVSGWSVIAPNVLANAVITFSTED